MRRLTEEDVDKIYALSVGNSMLYQYCPALYCGDDGERDHVFERVTGLWNRMNCSGIGC